MPELVSFVSHGGLVKPAGCDSSIWPIEGDTALLKSFAPTDRLTKEPLGHVCVAIIHQWWIIAGGFSPSKQTKFKLKWKLQSHISIAEINLFGSTAVRFIKPFKTPCLCANCVNCGREGIIKVLADGCTVRFFPLGVASTRRKLRWIHLRMHCIDKNVTIVHLRNEAWLL